MGDALVGVHRRAVLVNGRARGRNHLRLFMCLLLISGCRETEEEKLQKRVNVAETHLYVAMKLAMSDAAGASEQEPSDAVPSDVRRVRESIVQLEAGLRQINEGAANRALVDARNLQAVAEITMGLWGLRQQGRAEVEKWRESKLSVLGYAVLPSDQAVSLPTEHAALLLGLAAMKLHPKAPAPAPQSALLYEAYLLGENEVEWQELDGLARSAQAIVFSGEQLCEMAETSTARLGKLPLGLKPLSPQAMAGLFMGFGRVAAHAPEGALVLAAAVLAQQLPWAMRLLAFSKTATCLSNSSLPNAQQRASVQWEHAISVAEQAGFASPELGFLRAYLAYQQNDLERVQRELRVAQESGLLSPEERQQLSQLGERFDPSQRGTIDAFMDPWFVSQWVVRLVHHRLQAVGFYEQLARIPVVELVTHVFQSVTLPSEDSAKRWGSDVWRWIKSKWQAAN